MTEYRSGADQVDRRGGRQTIGLWSNSHRGIALIDLPEAGALPAAAAPPPSPSLAVLSQVAAARHVIASSAFTAKRGIFMFSTFAEAKTNKGRKPWLLDLGPIESGPLRAILFLLQVEEPTPFGYIVHASWGKPVENEEVIDLWRMRPDKTKLKVTKPHE